MRCSKSLLLNCVCFLVLMSVVAAGAETLRLPNIFGDHMVLQCELPVVVWGWAEEGAKVTVSFGAQSKSTKGDSDGRWRVRLKPPEASSRAAVLQVHNPSAKQTIFALTNWSSGQKADVGIGNSPQGNLDYTFRANAGEYQLKRLMVLVRQAL